MEMRCYSCGSKDFQTGKMAIRTKNEVVVFTQTSAEVQVCKQCGAILTMTGEHPHYKTVKEQY